MVVVAILILRLFNVMSAIVIAENSFLTVKGHSDGIERDGWSEGGNEWMRDGDSIVIK